MATSGEATDVPKKISPQALWQWENTKRRTGFLAFMGVCPTADGETVQGLYEEVERMAGEFADNISVDPVAWRGGERLNKRHFGAVVQALAASPHGLLRPQHILQYFRNRYPHLWRQTGGTATTVAVVKAIHVVLSSRKFLQVEADVDPVTSDRRVVFFAIDYQSYPDAPAPGTVLRTTQDEDDSLPDCDENITTSARGRCSTDNLLSVESSTHYKTPKKVHLARSSLRRALEESNGQNQNVVSHGNIKRRWQQKEVQLSPGKRTCGTNPHEEADSNTPTCSADGIVSTKDGDNNNSSRWQEYWDRCLDQEAPTYAFDLVGYVCEERLSRGFFPRVVNVFPRNLLLTAEQAVMECLAVTNVEL
ncbi:Hypp4540 [Branchiostoma lanceolatum]|uniref:Hypp4540 protein n=1 Tax=Branchiostoma lanceolatum TaxID=7740 RepID=A0A8K0A8L6_BRALA|nr:Hypp4540 [Branchiostoma lanceolatum]